MSYKRGIGIIVIFACGVGLVGFIEAQSNVKNFLGQASYSFGITMEPTMPDMTLSAQQMPRTTFIPPVALTGIPTGIAPVRQPYLSPVNTTLVTHTRALLAPPHKPGEFLISVMPGFVNYNRYIGSVMAPASPQVLRATAHTIIADELNMSARIHAIKPDSAPSTLNQGGLIIKVSTNGISEEDALTRLLRVPDFIHIEPNYIFNTMRTPNDPRYGELWGLRNSNDKDIDADEAWDVRHDSTVIVGVIDTGVDYTHPDLKDNMWNNPRETPNNKVDDDGNGYIDDYYGYNFIGNGSSDPMDDHFHGTHVAGTIGARGDNSLGVVGVNWKVKIAALKFLSAKGGGTLEDAVESIDYATQMKFKITNNSWGCQGCNSQILKNAIESNGAMGGLFIAAAGNNGVDIDTVPFYPAGYPLDTIISVAATDRNDIRANFSNYGVVGVDVAAPGVSILSTWPGNTYRAISGTSMAAPHVAGAAALYMANGATWQETKRAILDTVDVIGLPIKTRGRINVARLLRSTTSCTTKLTLNKRVINDNGGTLSVADFPLFINSQSVISGASECVTPNVEHRVSETQHQNYTASAWGGDCSVDGRITVGSGESKTCTITNDDKVIRRKRCNEITNALECRIAPQRCLWIPSREGGYCIQMMRS